MTEEYQELEQVASRIAKATDDWGFCGCETPEAALELVRDVLATFEDRTEYDPKRHDALLPGDGVRFFVLYMLTHWDLIEHGSSVGGSWLTDKGRATLSDLRHPRAIELSMHENFTPIPDRRSPSPTDPSWKVDLEEDGS